MGSGVTFASDGLEIMSSESGRTFSFFKKTHFEITLFQTNARIDKIICWNSRKKKCVLRALPFKDTENESYERVANIIPLVFDCLDTASTAINS